MPMRVAIYLNGSPPPLDIVSSVRAIVFRQQSVLVVTQENGEMYVLPGGRVEDGESPEKTLRREMLEETGWSLSNSKPFGCMYFHHLAPKPEGYRYPYPDFLWPIYIAEAGVFTPETVIPDDFVFKSEFMPVNVALKLKIEPSSLVLLEEAVKVR